MGSRLTACEFKCQAIGGSRCIFGWVSCEGKGHRSCRTMTITMGISHLTVFFCFIEWGSQTQKKNAQQDDSSSAAHDCWSLIESITMPIIYVIIGLEKTDPPRFEHGSPAPEAGVISRLHHGSLVRACGSLLMNASVIEYSLARRWYFSIFAIEFQIQLFLRPNFNT